MSKATEKILTACAVIVAGIAIAQAVGALIERVYYAGVSTGWRECIEENNLYERYYYGQ